MDASHARAGLTLVDAARAVQIPVSTAARLLRKPEAAASCAGTSTATTFPAASCSLARDGDPVRRSPYRT
jgi:hypothetical protein